MSLFPSNDIRSFSTASQQMKKKQQQQQQQQSLAAAEEVIVLLSSSDHEQEDERRQSEGASTSKQAKSNNRSKNRNDSFSDFEANYDEIERNPNSNDFDDFFDHYEATENHLENNNSFDDDLQEQEERYSSFASAKTLVNSRTKVGSENRKSEHLGEELNSRSERRNSNLFGSSLVKPQSKAGFENKSPETYEDNDSKKKTLLQRHRDLKHEMDEESSIDEFDEEDEDGEGEDEQDEEGTGSEDDFENVPRHRSSAGNFSAQTRPNAPPARPNAFADDDFVPLSQLARQGMLAVDYSHFVHNADENNNVVLDVAQRTTARKPKLPSASRSSDARNGRKFGQNKYNKRYRSSYGGSYGSQGARKKKFFKKKASGAKSISKGKTKSSKFGKS